MALVRIPPVRASVRWDHDLRRPRDVRWAGGHHLRVTELASVRDERAAYPASQGPRLTLLVRTDGGGRASIAFDGRRWYLEALEPAA